jgi:hypothetical protein
MERQKVVGTNCYNCMYVSKNSETVESKELNSQGGIDQSTDDTLKRAEKADLITLPGGSAADTTDKKFCNHPKIQMYVTGRMCCAYWDNPGARRPWKLKSKEAQTAIA